jgi:uncharacterized protein (DUF427 family)
MLKARSLSVEARSVDRFRASVRSPVKAMSRASEEEGQRQAEHAAMAQEFAPAIADTRLDILSPSRYISRCPYKGISNYYPRDDAEKTA